MIVEFTGPTGTGKSTCIAHVADCLASRGIVAGVIGGNAKQMRGIPETFAFANSHNWKTDVAALPWACLLMVEHPGYAWLVVKAILRLDSHRVAVVRAVIRKVGIHRFLSRRRFRDRIVLIDEGIVHVGHNILVSPVGHQVEGDLLKFAEVSPVPTLAIILAAPYETLLSRLQARGDLSPRIRTKSDLSGFTQDAVRFFSVVAPLLLQRTPGLHIDTTRAKSLDIGNAVAKAICEILSRNKPPAGACAQTDQHGSGNRKRDL